MGAREVRRLLADTLSERYRELTSPSSALFETGECMCRNARSSAFGGRLRVFLRLTSRSRSRRRCTGVLRDLTTAASGTERNVLRLGAEHQELDQLRTSPPMPKAPLEHREPLTVIEEDPANLAGEKILRWTAARRGFTEWSVNRRIRQSSARPGEAKPEEMIRACWWRDLNSSSPSQG